MKLSPFEWFDIISGKTKISEEDIHKNLQDGYEPFMINRIFSNDNSLIKYAIILNKKGISNRMHFELCRASYKATFGNKVVFIPYAKATKEPPKIELIMNYYNVSEKIAKEYAEVISDEELVNITNYYRQLDEFNKKQKVR